MNFREEFQWKKFGFSESVPIPRFFVFHWRIPGLLYVIYRIIVAAYCMTWLIYTAKHDSDTPLNWGVFLTTWTYTLETIYFTLHAAFAIHFYFCSLQRNQVSLKDRITLEEQRALFSEIGIREDTPVYVSSLSNVEQNLLHPECTVARPNSLPWYVILLWILLNCVSSAAVMVSLVFWAVLVPSNTGLGNLSLGNLQLHLVNSILLLIEHALTAFPIRVLHVIYPILYGVIYMFFSVFYWVDDHSHVMYNILDWNKPGIAIGCVLGVGFLVIPIIHLIIYGFYRLKLKIFTAYCL